MAGFFSDISQRFGTVFANLSPGQKLSMVLVILIAVAGVWGIVHWASAPEYVPLFSNLPPEDAGKIVDWLQENSIEYKLENGGSRILVQKRNQYDARIQLAQEGLPTQRSTGYEIFDKTNLGMSEFVQKLNFRRALEGELSRTVETLEEVETARVHIVMPEEALFREKEKPATASVALKLRSSIRENQVMGISHLVASAVEGLEADQVTILDARGNVLTPMNRGDDLVSMTNTQMSLKQEMEQTLTTKVGTMLDRLLGEDKAIVRVAVDLDMTESSSTAEQFDPEQTAVRSEEIVESQRATSDEDQVNPADPTQEPLGSTTQLTETNNITNYEVSKTVTSTRRRAGGIERITASVLVDGVYEQVTGPDGETTQEYRDRTQQELNLIEQAVRGALGMDPGRGDEITVSSFAFEVKPPVEPETGIWVWLRNNWMTVLRSVLLGGAVVGALFWLRNLLQKSSAAAREAWERRLATLPGGRAAAALPGAVGEGEERLALPDIDSELPPEVVEANQLQQQLIEFSLEKPEVAARLLKTWLVDN